MRSRSCAGEKYTLLIGPRSGWLTRAGQTVRRRARRLLPQRDAWTVLAKVRSTGGQLFATLATGAAPRTAPRGGLKLAAARCQCILPRTGSGCMRSWTGAAVAFGWQGVSRRSAGGPHTARNGASLRTDFRAYCLAACCWPWFALGHLTWERQRDTVELPSTTIEHGRAWAPPPVEGRRSASLLCAAGAGEAIILVRGDAPPDHARRARAAADARRPRSGPRPRPPRAGSPCRSPDRRFSWRGVPCRDHRSPAA
jgi:hypothetical protein